MLVADAGFPGLAVVLGEGDGRRSRSTRTASSRAAPPRCRLSPAGPSPAGLTGFEWAVGVPGSIGGAVRMNAGGHGSDMAAVLREGPRLGPAPGRGCRAVPAAALALGYRHSAIEPHQVVACGRAAPADPVTDRRARPMLAEIVRWRRDHQPGGQNAGSVFTNPAGRLGGSAHRGRRRQGSAGTAPPQVSPKHANFIQRRPRRPGRRRGRADAPRCAQQVLDRAGVLLDIETRLVGCTLDSRPEVEG